MGEELDAERTDAGYLHRNSGSYQPGQFEWTKEAGSVPSIAELSVDLRDPYVGYLVGRNQPATCEDLTTDGVMQGDLRSNLLAQGARAKMGICLKTEMGPLGFLCVDRITTRNRRWKTGQFELFETVGRIILPEILACLALPQAKPTDSTAQKNLNADLSLVCQRFQLSGAETSVAELLFDGLSYKQIAIALNKSPHTVDHQARSIRKKMGLPPHSSLAFELRRRCGPDG